MKRLTTITRLSVALLAGLSALQAHADSTVAPTSHAVHKKTLSHHVTTLKPIVIHLKAGEPINLSMQDIAHKAGIKLASVDDPYSPDYQLPPEQAAAMVDMIYQTTWDTWYAMDVPNLGDEVMSCTCTVTHQNDRPATVRMTGLSIVQGIPSYDPVTPGARFVSESAFQSNGKLYHGLGAGNND